MGVLTYTAEQLIDAMYIYMMQSESLIARAPLMTAVPSAVCRHVSNASPLMR